MPRSSSIDLSRSRQSSDVIKPTNAKCNQVFAKCNNLSAKCNKVNCYHILDSRGGATPRPLCQFNICIIHRRHYKFKLCRAVSNCHLRHLLLLLYGYYQSRFGLIPRSRGGRWGLIKATVCSNILQMFVCY